MPPRKRVVKTVRKTTARLKASAAAAAQSSSPPPLPSAPEETPATPSASAPETATPVIETPVSEINTCDATPELDPTPLVTADPKPASETPAAPDDAAKTEAMDSEPAAPDETPAAADPVVSAVKATATRVRKVVKKKIIKRMVPKVKSLAAKQEAKIVEETVVDVPPRLAAPVVEEKPLLISEDAIVLVATTAEPEPEPEPEQMETNNVDSDEKKDLSIEQDKEDRGEEHGKGEGGEETASVEAASVAAATVGDEEAGMSERQKRRKTEIFVGGLDRDAKEDDLRKVFSKVGEIVEVRMMIDVQTGKNKGYAFVRYKEVAQAKKAVSDFSKVEICGKICGAAALEGNDTIFLGNIDKKWKKEDLIKVLQDMGIEKIDTVTVMVDPNNEDINRGFAFLELETNRDAQIAYRKLSKKDAFGKGRNIKVAWAEPLNDPDEEEMQKVKSVYVECIPSSWDESKVRESFKKFGVIERVVLARNMQSAKRKDFAFVNYSTRESALSCIESFDKEEFTENGLKVNLKVSLAKPLRKNKQNKVMLKPANTKKEQPKSVQTETRVGVSSNKRKPSKGGPSFSVGDVKSSTTNELLHLIREQAAWKHGQIGYGRGPVLEDYSHAVAGGKRPFSHLGENAPYSDLRGYPRARLDSSYPVASSSYAVLPQGVPSSSLAYYQHPVAGYTSGALYGMDRTSTLQRQGDPPHGSSLYSRYKA